MVDTTVFILHYSDERMHPTLVNRKGKRKTISNLALNELLLRCTQSIKRNTKYPHKLVIVDNGSMEAGHEDAVNLLKENGLAPEFLWIREDWHPVAVGANRAMDALETDYMAFITSDMKPGLNWLQHMIEPLKQKPWHMTACEPNITMYGVGDPNRYRTPEFWEALKRDGDNIGVQDYFKNNGVGVEMDEWNEPVPHCRPFIKEGNERISIFTASRDFIDKVGRYDEKYLRACEYQYFFQALKRGIENPTSEASYTYLSHYGSLFRTGVGAYHPDDWKYHPTTPTKSKGEDFTDSQHVKKRGVYEYRRGAHNVFAKKDLIGFRKKNGIYEIYDTKTGNILKTTSNLGEAITKWEGMAQ